MWLENFSTNYGKENTFFFSKANSFWEICRYDNFTKYRLRYKGFDGHYPSPETENAFQLWFNLSRKKRKAFFAKYTKPEYMSTCTGANFDINEDILMKNVTATEAMDRAYALYNSLTLANCTTAVVESAPPNVPKTNKKGNTMYDDCDCDCGGCCTQVSDERKQRNFLNHKLIAASDTKRQALRKQFGLSEDTRPNTLNDLVQRFKDGKFVIPEGRGDEYHWHVLDLIEWRDPAVKKDSTGFAAAEKLLEAAQDDAEVSIELAPIADALAAFKTFQAQDFSKSA